MEQQEYFEQLQNSGDIFEVHEVIKTFRVYRKTRSGETQLVKVEISDAGESANPRNRYSCKATAEDGATASGNAENSIEHAILTVKWGNLDK